MALLSLSDWVLRDFEKLRMGSFYLRVLSGLLVVSLFSSTVSYVIEEGFEPQFDNGYTKPSYDRIDEVKKVCASVLASASELELTDDRVYSMKSKLSFYNGDWEQQGGSSPLMPFDDQVHGNFSYSKFPLQLASFTVTDVHVARPAKKIAGVNGVLDIIITLDGPIGEFGGRARRRHSQFKMWPGHTRISIYFQGVYTESNKGGERVMCLLGDTMLPSRSDDSKNPWGWVKASSPKYNQPPLLQDDQILLTLHYPKTLSLTRMAIQGKMKSLNPSRDPKYFDEVRIVSQLTAAKYQFSSDSILSKACDPYPIADSLVNGKIDIYRGFGFCRMIKAISSEGAFNVVPNWRCNGKKEFCSKLGPFKSGEAIRATNGEFKDVKLLMQNTQCKWEVVEGNVTMARVFAVFRAVAPGEIEYVAAQRSGLGNMTLAAEGIWKSSSGQLCMVGCPETIDGEGKGCDSRICLYIPKSYSITQRSVMLGSISSINTDSPSYFPLSFEKPVLIAQVWDYYRLDQPSYEYSRFVLAGDLQEKDEPLNLGAVIKKSILKFPKLEEAANYMLSLSLLSEDLTFHLPAAPDPIPSSRPSRTDVQMEILSLGPFFGRYWGTWGNYSMTREETPFRTKANYTEKQLLLNVSAELTLTGKPYNNFSALSLEGLYDPYVGKMYLVGCRDVRSSWKKLSESMNIEVGMDCSIEAVVSYPPTIAWGLVDLAARISISSKRAENDPLYFRPIKLQTAPIMYRQQARDILSQQGVEGILRILTLSVAIACIVSQMFYIRNVVDSVPYMSLVMLGIQVLGYSLPLITGAEAVFKKKHSEPYQRTSYDFEKNHLADVVDYMVKLLVLVCFILTLRLFQKVWKSRIRLLASFPQGSHHVPGDKRVFLATLTIHVIGYITILIFQYAETETSQTPILMQRGVNLMGNSQAQNKWEILLEEYIGLVHDLFLLPQILGNFMWRINCQPLRKLYYIGITIIRVLPHAYDYIRPPTTNPYFVEEYEFVNPKLDFYSKFGDIAIPLMAVLLAVVIYVQQRWNYEKLGSTATIERHKAFPPGSRVYERLPSHSVETELVSGASSSDGKKKELGDDREDV
ncbi:hypothetical protein Ancab_011994 [Ancistrocladus abbreviatus]